MTSIIFLFALLIVSNYVIGSLDISAHMSMKIVLVDANLVHTFFEYFFDPNYGATMKLINFWCALN